jgi:hypothetical protein
MGRAEGTGNFTVVFRFLIRVFNQQADRAAGGFALEHPRQDPDLIRLAPLGGVTAGARLAPVQLDLQIFFANFQSRGTAVDDRSERRTMGLAKGSDAEEFAEAVACHDDIPRAGPAQLKIQKRSRYCSSCARVSKNTPCPPRSKSSQVKGTSGQFSSTAA